MSRPLHSQGARHSDLPLIWGVRRHGYGWQHEWRQPESTWERILIRLQLSKRERRLIIDHTYPFTELEEQLTKLDCVHEAATVEIASFYLERLLADIVYSAKALSDEALLEELDALYTELEIQARDQGYRGTP